MPFTPRPDSFLVLSGPKPANRTGNTATGIDSLSGFVSEAQPAAIPAPTAVAVSVTPDAAKVVSDVTTPAKPRPPLRQRRTGLVASIRRLRTLDTAAAAAFIVIAVASGSAVIITLLGGSNRPSTSDRPSTNVPPTSQAVTPTLPLPTLTGPAVPPDPRWEVSAVTPDPPKPSSPVAATTNRAVSTTGRRTAVPNQATKPSRATSSSYRGSLAIRSAPQGARVFVNGALVGSTPLDLNNLPVGSRAVRIEADGYEGWSASTRIVANQQTRMSATLARAKP